ncbi:zinc finger CCCH domain-containing protein 7A [Chanos chanos]|uniref:Zinc finger CCCH domain-containing protein 7A n=1 Tax=Chanos chanos TaxID=29144 RepID=A0A6J2WQQ2_CHACN|nr:zinc finger CCCH domain-containing protein 7A [Chanos chanos]
MSNVCQDRSSRWQSIQEGLQFIQSTLPFPGSQEQYEVFIQDLVRNLFGEGNDVFSEGEWMRSVELYTEALNIAEYGESEDISISAELREKLHANRAASYLNIGLHDQALEDCDAALTLNEGNHRALYRKARSLKELGRHKEAYEAVAKCSMAVPQDASVMQLTHELAKMLGLKIRKAYVRSKPALNVLPGSNLSGASNDKYSPGSASMEDIETELHHFDQGASTPLSTATPACPPVAEPVEKEPAPLSIIPPIAPVETRQPEPSPMPVVHTPLVNGVRTNESFPVTEPRLDYDTDIIGDELDELLDRASPAQPSMNIPTVEGPITLPTRMPTSDSMPNPLLMSAHITHPFMNLAPQCTVNLPAPYHKPGSSGYPLGLDSFVSPLDSLDSLSLSDSQSGSHSPGNYDQLSFLPLSNSEKPIMPPIGMAFGMPEGHFTQEVDLNTNPLAETHEFKQACSACFVKTGSGVLDYTHYAEEHKCKKDLLLGRIKLSPNPRWKLIRPRPTKNQYAGPYYICKDVSMGEECRYPGHCTFAYCQEEIDVWTLERKGFLCREQLCDPFGTNKNNLTVSRILQEHHGIFMFLCEVCFDHKPRIISKTNKDNPSLCSHPVTKHAFEEKKCLVHILKDNQVRYSKIRPYTPLCQLDLCRHEVRYGCQREDGCFYAHSPIELKVWLMQRDRGISPESIVQEARKYWNMEANSQALQELPGALKKFGPPNLKMQFVCAVCWRNGQVVEPDKNKKYCSAKARHPWSKDKRVVLVSSNERKKWTTIRPLPTKKPIPSQFEICLHVAAGKKCQYIGNCTFAHSPEEKDMWTYMKDNNISDMEQLYELWLQSQKPGWSEENSSTVIRENGKQIHMPTDYAEEVAGNHCWLCGKNCNSDKQWQQHITSEKHKERVFNSEDDQNCWQYRFPTGTFKVCERYLKGTCTEEEHCKLAHGEEELKEWKDRREFLLMKLAKARKDHLIAPNDNDFGKYSFLLKDIN